MDNRSGEVDPVGSRLDVVIRLLAVQLVAGEPTLAAKIRRLEAIGIGDRGELAVICGTTPDSVRATSNRAKKAGDAKTT